MNKNNLKQLLLEYEKKRNSAILIASNRKTNIYLKYPHLQEIDDEISKCSLYAAKHILLNNSMDYLDNLKKKIDVLKGERKQLLQKIGISDSFFLPDFECKICNDTGYITKNYQTEMCNCLKQKLFDLEYNSSNTYIIKNQTFNNFKYDIYSDQVDKDKYNSNISPRKNIQLIKNICEKFISNFNDCNEKDLLFWGNSGLGKTFMSECIANALLQKNKTVLYQTAPIMLDSIIDYRLRKIKF